MSLLTPERLALVLGLSFFFGLAFEEFYHASRAKPPGGIRTFPLLALLGAGLYLIEPARGLVLAAGLLGLAAWLFNYYRGRLATRTEGVEDLDASLIVPVCNVIAFVLGPVTLVAPLWFAVALTVGAVMLLSARRSLHAFASRVAGHEIITLAKFLVLTGIVLPLLPDEPVTALSPITPYQAWLALIAVSALSYASYLAQRYLPIGDGALAIAVLGGLYSSTATTALIARRLRDAPAGDRQHEAGIVLATAVMYLRVGLVIAVFNLALAEAVAPALGALLMLGVALAGAILLRPGAHRAEATAETAAPANPLELSTAFVFAASFVIIAIAATWVKQTLGAEAFLWLAAVVGITDIDPFVLSVAQGSVPGAGTDALALAVLVAASSNNLLKAVYALAFSRARHTILASLALVALAAAGLAIAFWR